MRGTVSDFKMNSDIRNYETSMAPVENILVPTDFLPHSASALSLALGYGRPFGSTVHVLLAYRKPNLDMTGDEIVVPNDLCGVTLRMARHRLETLVLQIESAGLDGKCHLARGSAERTILDLANSIPADLIVMGTEGRTGFSHFLSGSVAEKVVRGAPCPVLTVTDRVRLDDAKARARHDRVQFGPGRGT